MAQALKAAILRPGHDWTSQSPAKFEPWMASLRQESTKTTNHQRNILTTPQRLADVQQFTKKNVCCLESVWLDLVMWCPAWQSRVRKERQKDEHWERGCKKIRVWSTLVIPETLTKRERQSLAVAEARGSQWAYSLKSLPTSYTQWKLLTLWFGVIYVKLDLVCGHYFSTAVMWLCCFRR